MIQDRANFFLQIFRNLDFGVLEFILDLLEFFAQL